MDVHHVTNDERRSLVTAQHTGGQGPRDLQIADVTRIDLAERAVPVVGIVAGLSGPIGRIAHLLIEVGIRDYRDGGHRHNHRGYADQQGPITVSHDLLLALGYRERRSAVYNSANGGPDFVRASAAINQ